MNFAVTSSPRLESRGCWTHDPKGIPPKQIYFVYQKAITPTLYSSFDFNISLVRFQ